MSNPPAEVQITAELVAGLIAEQCPQWTDRPLSLLGEGWDNAMYRLGNELIVRLPRRAQAVKCLLTEQRWLPVIAGQLSLPVPVPVHLGTPSELFAWPWSVLDHLPGRTLAHTLEADLAQVAVNLADFFVALHLEAPPELPASASRGVQLGTRSESFEQWVGRLADASAAERARELWNHAVAATPYTGAPVLLHGDPHPLNLLVDDSGPQRTIGLSGVIDFGDLTPGDPACDLGIGSLALRPAERARFRARIDRQRDPSADPQLWARADGWALYEAVIFAATGSPGSPEEGIGERALTTLGVR